MLPYIFIISGLLLLIKGGDFLIDGSVAIAQRAKLSPMVIGLTVIGFGTSMPELCVSAQAAWMGSSSIAIGNVAGSNICNIALILGLTAVMHPIPASRDTIRRSTPFFAFTLVLIILFAFNGTIERWMGIAMLAIITAQVTLEVKHSRKSGAGESSPKQQPQPCQEHQCQMQATGTAAAAMPMWKALLTVAISLAAMVWGSDMLVSGTTELAMALGSVLGIDAAQMERIIALTVVSIGTSLPELCASVIAARKGETDMAVGNIIGSGIFNILCVVGASSAITPIHNAWTPFAADYFIQLSLCVLLWIFLRTKRMLQRWEGFVFLFIYAAYLAFLLYSVN